MNGAMNENEQKMNIGQEERKAFASLRSQSLLREEKDVMRQALQTSIHRSGMVSIPVSNHQSGRIEFSSLFLSRSFAVSASALTILIGSSFGVARAAENSLPGQTLYPVKINVNESVIGSFKRSDTARADWERERAGRRIAEAETLAEEGKLGDEEKNEIERHLSENRKAFEEIEGRTVSDDEFFPQQIKGETKKINVRVEHIENEEFIHIDEREETKSDETKEEENGFIDTEESSESFGGYTEQGTKKEKKTGDKSDLKPRSTERSSSKTEEVSKDKSINKKADSSEKSIYKTNETKKKIVTN